MMNRNRINKFIQQHSSGDKNVQTQIRQQVSLHRYFCTGTYAPLPNIPIDFKMDSNFKLIVRMGLRVFKSLIGTKQGRFPSQIIEPKYHKFESSHT